MSVKWKFVHRFQTNFLLRYGIVLVYIVQPATTILPLLELVMKTLQETMIRLPAIAARSDVGPLIFICVIGVLMWRVLNSFESRSDRLVRR